MVKLFACGDVVNYHNIDGRLLDAELERIVQNCDYSVCNFEAPIQGYGNSRLKSGPHLSQKPETLVGLKEQGFDLALLANNHMMDFGKKGLQETLTLIDNIGIEAVGAGINKEKAYAPLIKNINGVKVGIINACEAQFGVIDHFKRNESAGYAWINHPSIDTTILNIKKECDFVLVFAHAGLENYSIPQKEWRERYKHLCDLGADAIIGSHPHVPQGYEKYSNSIIFYSLGNFYFDALSSSNAENESFSIVLTMEKGLPINFEPVFHYTKNKLVHIAPKDKKIDLANLCQRLDEGYDEEHNQMVRDCYPKISGVLIRSLSALPANTSVLGTLKELVATVIGRRRKQNKDLTAMHFIRNETYYYVVRHALELKAQEKELNE